MVWEVISSWLILYTSSSSVCCHSFSGKLSCPLQCRSRKLRNTNNTIQKSWFMHSLPCIKESQHGWNFTSEPRKINKHIKCKIQPFSLFLKPSISSFSIIVSLHPVLKVCFSSHMTILIHKPENNVTLTFTLTLRDISRLFQQSG